MKESAFMFTSGLGQVTDGPVESSPSIASDDDLTGISSTSTSTSTSSRSGELQRELFAVRILTKSPEGTKFISRSLNGGIGGGGGIGIKGDCEPLFKLSS